MTLFLILVVVVALALLVGLVARGRSGADARGSIGTPYTAAETLFSPAERSFLGVLDLALAGMDYRIFGKVRVGDIARLKPGMGSSARRGALNRISGKHFDFVVCRSTDLAVLAAIELNDKSHRSQRAQRRDDFLVSVCQAIGLPLIQVPAKASYSTDEIRSQVLAATGQAMPAPAALTAAGAG